MSRSDDPTPFPVGSVVDFAEITHEYLPQRVPDLVETPRRLKMSLPRRVTKQDPVPPLLVLDVFVDDPEKTGTNYRNQNLVVDAEGAKGWVDCIYLRRIE